MSAPIDPTAVYGSVLPEPGTLDAAGAGRALGRVKRLRAWLDSYEARVTSHVGALSAAGQSIPAADLHTRDGGVSSKEAQQKERRAKVLDHAPSLAERLAAGEVTAGHADALANATSRLDDETCQAVFDRDDDLAADAARMSPEEFAKNCRDLVQRLERDQGIERDRQQRRETRVTTTVGRDGMYVLNARLHPELGNVVFNALDAETAALVKRSGDRTVDRAQVRADALGNLVTGGHQAARPSEAEIRLHVSAERLIDESSDEGCCEFDDGRPAPPSLVRRLACNGRIVPIIVDTNGVVLDAGRDQRLANRHQRRALRAMHMTCTFPGCDVAFNRCEIHHLQPFELGGRTDLHDLVPLCCRHHHVVHELDLRLTLDADRTLTVRERDGTLHGRRPLRPPGRSPGRPDGTRPSPAPASTAGLAGSAEFTAFIESTGPPGDPQLSLIA